MRGTGWRSSVSSPCLAGIDAQGQGQGADANAAHVRVLHYKDFLTLWKDADPHIRLLKPSDMQNPVKERIAKLREEIAQISEANRLYI